MPHLRGHGSTRFLSSATVRNAQQAVVALDIVNLMDALHIPQAIVAGFDWGARTACIMAALWPERCKAMVSVSGYLMTNLEAAGHPLPPKAERDWWYQYYFATERGQAGYAQYRREFARLIWETASPKWHFDDATFDRSAAAFENPDHVAVAIHNYRWRLDLAQGEARYDDLEKRLAAAPVIGIPTITLEGDANGAPFLAPGRVSKQVLRQVRAPDAHRRHRPRPAARGAAGVRAGRHRRRPARLNRRSPRPRRRRRCVTYRIEHGVF